MGKQERQSYIAYFVACCVISAAMYGLCLHSLKGAALTICFAFLGVLYLMSDEV
jgi:hypothetical protein